MLFLQVWAEDLPLGLDINHAPLIIALNVEATQVAFKQCLMSQEAYLGIQPHIYRLKQVKILVECQ